MTFVISAWALLLCAIYLMAVSKRHQRRQEWDASEALLDTGAILAGVAFLIAIAGVVVIAQ